MSALRVPDLPEDVDTLGAGLAYAEAGWYVGPVSAGTKRPAISLGKGWPRLTSREPEVIVSWFAGTDHGIFLHAGRSGAVILDVDNPDKLHPLVAKAILEAEPPHQSTRPDQPGRCHYLFTSPVGRDLGNGVGTLANGWGEVRGRNGLIVVAPTVHAEGGRYQWLRTGPVPTLPACLARELPDALDAADAATDAIVGAFLAEHHGNTRPELLDVHCRSFLTKVAEGESRHVSMCGHLAGAMKEARLGMVPAKAAADTLEGVFLAAVAKPGKGRQGSQRAGGVARNEWRALLAWAVAQARAADPDKARRRIAEKVPDLLAWAVPRGQILHGEVPRTPVDVDTPPGPPPDDEDDLRAVVFRRFPRLDLAGLLKVDRPPRQWVIDGLVPAGASVALVAPAGTGKSLLLLAAVLAVARGDRHFAGLPLTRRRVILVDMENTEDDLADRLLALGVTPESAADLADLVVVHLPPLTPLDTAMGASELAAIIDAYDVQAGDVVALDSLQRVIAGAENDSDTMRAFYRHTAVMLKRRGLTVIRTDNTGKDAEKGARGTSGKRDDVDVELILTADVEKPERLRLRPGKVRIPGIRSVVVNRDLDDDGRLTYTTAGDPFRLLVGDAHRLLDELSIPTDAGERKAAETIKGAGRKVVRAALRVAIKERRDSLNVRGLGAPRPYGAPGLENGDDDCAEQTRRTYGAPHDETTNPQVSAADRCAEPRRRTVRAADTDAHGGGAPLRSLYKERRTGALAQNPIDLDEPAGLDDDATEAPPSCPSCLHQTAGPPGRTCNTPDLHPNGVLL